MKLFTYNFLTSKPMKGVKVGYPLKLKITEKNVSEREFDPVLMARLLPRLEWSAVRLAAEVAELSDGIPTEQPDNASDNEELMQKLHHLLLEIDVLDGQLECPETGRIFPITNGIPNMLLNEDEV